MINKDASVNNTIWGIPFLPTIPKVVRGLSSPHQLISNRVAGEWQFLFQTLEDIPSPYAKNQNYDFDTINKALWRDVMVPGSLSMQGFDIQNNCEYYYKTIIKKEDLGSQEFRSFVRFQGVYCNCRVWINNSYVATHVGGFAPFDIELTEFNNGQDIVLVVGIADIEGSSSGIWNPDSIKVSSCSWGSFYAHNNIGGILRDVTIYHLSKDFVLSQKMTTSLFNDYRDGKLHIKFLVSSGSDKNLISITLKDTLGNLIKTKDLDIDKTNLVSVNEFDKKFDIDFSACKYKTPNQRQSDENYSKAYVPFQKCKLLSGNKLFLAEIEIDYPNIMSWTAEIPHLYSIEITLAVDGKMVSMISEKIGFRQIEYGGQNGKDINKVYVNGKEVKLRGVCRHDISYRYGRSLSKDEELEEILAFKRNNVNHVRTSHYPCTKNYAELCDKFGIYLELENGVCFKGSNGYDMNCSPDEILQSLSEVIEYYHNHPSVLIWSIANESGFDKSVAYRLSYNYIKEKDKSRPVIFSYPFTTLSAPKPYDIFSKHYKKVTSDLGKKDMPILHDEFAHVACYNVADLSIDNNFRLAWGESIQKGWDNILDSDGALGCAIWGGIDDIFYLPFGVNGAHQRHTSALAVGYGEWGAILDVFRREKPEAYLTKKAFSPIRITDYQLQNGKLILKVKNRFDHVNLNQVEYKLIKNDNQVVSTNTIKESILPKTDGEITINMIADISNVDIAFFFDNNEVERERFDFYSKDKVFFTKNFLGNDIKLKANLIDGKVEICSKGNIIATAPYFYIGAKRVNSKSSKVVFSDDKTIRIREKFGLFKTVTYEITKTDDGIIFRTNNSALMTALLTKKYGVGLLLKDEVESVKWDKNNLYSYYPNNHLERAHGTAYAKPKEINEYGKKPAFGWKDDSHNYFLSDESESQILRVTNDFLTTRTNINNYSVNFVNDHSLSITPLNCQTNCYTSYTNKTEYIDCTDKKVHYNGRWHLIHKNGAKQCMVSRKKDSSLSLDFVGSNIKIYGTRSKEQGKIAIYIDGELYKILSTRSDICDVLDFSVLYNLVDLKDEKHTLKIEILDNLGVRLRGFEVNGNNPEVGESILYVSVGKDYNSLAWGNYYQNKLSPIEKRALEFKINICQTKK